MKAPRPLQLSSLVILCLLILDPLKSGEQEEGFTPIFDGITFEGWEQDGNWVIADRAFHRRERGGPLRYTASKVPDDFELRFEWMVSEGCNSGVYYRPGQVEYQVLDNSGSPYGENARQAAASLFFCMAPSRDATRPAGEWNTARIICQGSVIEHWLNEERVLSFDYEDPKWAPYVELLAIRGGNLSGRGGTLSLQDHGQDVSFRRLRWREILPSEKITPDAAFRPLPVTGVAEEKERERVKGMLEERDPTGARAKLDPLYSALRDSLVAEVPIWDGNVALPKSEEIPRLEGVRFSVIKPYEFEKDGYRFLHGVALCFHRGKLFASFAHNRGAENSETEEARFCVSEDEGRTWGDIMTLDTGDKSGLGVSHGVFLSHEGRLWAFQGAYWGKMKEIHTRAYLFDDDSGKWESKGVVIEGGFWPMQEPVKMEDGNWIMGGLSGGVYDAKGTFPAAVAISHGNDLTKWDLVVIPPRPGLSLWGESTLIVEGKRVVSISRYGAEAKALVAASEDFGRTWSAMAPSNLPMATSKPISGRLSDGRRYLVCTTTADSGKRRSPLTIALSDPGKELFNKVFVIRPAVFPEGPGESDPGASLAYPYAIEHEGNLYIGYSNSGGGIGRVGEGRELANNNSAELAVIPIERLR